MKFSFFLLVPLFFSVSAFGGVKYERCFKEAAELYNLDKKILLSIAQVESKLNPYALNFAGRSKYYKTQKEALTALYITEDQANIDIGIMQINTFWFRKLKVPYEQGFNACYNIHLGAYILAEELYQSKGDLAKAIGRYHSPTKHRQQTYLEKVAAAYKTF